MDNLYRVVILVVFDFTSLLKIILILYRGYSLRIRLPLILVLIDIRKYPGFVLLDFIHN